MTTGRELDDVSSTAPPAGPTRRLTEAFPELAVVDVDPLPAAPPLRDLPRRTGVGWERRQRCVTVGVDTALVAAIAAVTFLIVEPSPGHTASGVMSVALLLGGLWATRSWDPVVLGQGAPEFRRVVHACAAGGALLAAIAVVDPTLSLRPWVLGFVPAVVPILLVHRYVQRQLLHRRRDRGHCQRNLLAVGTLESVTDLIERTGRDSWSGYRVGGVCTPTGLGDGEGTTVRGVPVLGDLDQVADVAWTGGFRAVSISPCPGWTSVRLHQLSWDLEGSAVDLVVDPGLMEVAGPRLHVAPIDGLPLLRLSSPVFTGSARVTKQVVDWLGALLLVVALAPLLAVVALAVRSDGGPVLYRQTRVGRGSREFGMLKFRSMVVDADRLRAGLAAVDEGAGPLFKLRADPRVTRVGAVLRRYSLDELPQLFNVLTGSMSLVGPRPPLPIEVSTYTRPASRKFLVKPGLTGLWQVSGRSDLSWEESVRLDLRYVENWNLVTDLVILGKTVGAVLRSRGAY